MAERTFSSNHELPGALAYIEWFTIPRTKHVTHKMYPVSHSMINGVREASVVEVSSIVRFCQLYPKFDERADRVWTSNNVLEHCTDFFVNNWLDHHTYATVF